ncbi:MAG: aldo/keto reductase [Spirochaetia bacterium]|nr:aldo/keto reductase [Spirochaetia bacterium]NCC89963.1 aldo/keto reductase [Spirochaetia bacterium]
MKLGNTDMEIPALALGTWAIGGGDSWGESDDALSIKTIHRSLELGVTFIDTAPAYGNGLSEDLLGKALQGRRSSCILATKCGLVWGADDDGSVHKSRDGVVIRRNLSPRSIQKQVEESLVRLKTDHIDLLLTHWQSIEPFFTPIEETVEALEALQKEGKIRSYGACNVELDHLKEYQKHGKPALIQERYSMLTRNKAELASYCAEQGITFQAYSPLERGLLTGKASEQVIGSAKTSISWFEPGKRERVQAMLHSLEGMAQKYHATVGNLVIAWTKQAYPTMNVLCGARKPEQMEENAKALSLTITSKDWDIMDSLARALL